MLTGLHIRSPDETSYTVEYFYLFPLHRYMAKFKKGDKVKHDGKRWTVEYPFGYRGVLIRRRVKGVGYLEIGTDNTEVTLIKRRTK